MAAAAAEGKGVSVPLGVCLRAEYDRHSLSDLTRHARTAEAHGFHSVWMAESWGRDAIALLGHVGAVTRRVKLGTAIINVFSRSPGLLAMAAYTLNDLYESRFILGLGTSTADLVEKWHGMTFERPVTRMRETTEIVRQLLAGEQVRYEGRTVSLDGYRLRSRPNCAAPPIYLAALSANSLKVVATHADGWIPYLIPVRGVQRLSEQLHQAARDAGRPDGAITIAPLVTTCVAHDHDAAVDAARRHIGFYLGAMGPNYRKFVAGFGFEREVEAIRVAWAAGDKAGAFAAVTDELVDELAIAGAPAAARAQIERLARAGAHLPLLFFPGTSTNEMVETALTTLNASAPAQEVPA